MTEPINLREWLPSDNNGRRGRLFTCGRPGRATYGRQKVTVGEDIIDQWASGLPKADELHVVSLLGHKTTGLSEFWYYPFRSSKEPGDQPTFEKWLNRRYGKRFTVHEFPTVDGQGIPPNVLDDAARQALRLLETGQSVVVIDSAGAERTARVCKAIGYRPVTDQA